MESNLTEKEIAEQFADLQLSFPFVAPRLLMNLELDKDPYFGFDTPVLKTMAKYQVPFLLDLYIKIGAFTQDATRTCGFRPLVHYRITDGTGKTKEQKAAYLKNFANLVSERISEGHPNKMAAATFVMTKDQHDKFIDTILPILHGLRSVPPSSDTRGVRVMFCTLMEDYS